VVALISIVFERTLYARFYYAGELDQVLLNGRIVIPVGTRENQDLMVATKTEKGITRERLGLCRFVPLLGTQAWQEE